MKAHISLFLLTVHALDIGDNTQPTKSGIGTWIDVDTPKEVYNKTTSRGEVWQLVMSDEFNLEGRNFTAGEDHLWVALDIPDGVNRAIEVYKPSNAYTKNGTFIIRVDSGEVDISYYNVWANMPGWESKKMWYTSAMVQTWNKFCIQGGFIEISMKLPGATNNGSLNPNVVGQRWTQQGMVPVKELDPISDIRFYPTWPGLWMMGNLGRALFAASTNKMWPWTYNECTELSRVNQRISACDANPGYGLHPNMGRGSPEIDILEGGGTAISSSVQIAPGMPDDYRLTTATMKYENTSNVDPQGRHGVGYTACYYDKNCLTPGANMADVTTAAYASRGHKSWYQGLRYAENNRCTPDATLVQQYESVAAAQNSVITDNQWDIKTISSGRDLHADLGLIDNKGIYHWGINYNGTCFPIANGYKGGFLCNRDSQNPKCQDPRSNAQPATNTMEKFEYQMDAISSNWGISYEAYVTFYKYQLEWVTGPDGYIRWTLADAPIFEIPAATMTNPPQGTGNASYNPKKIMIEEPSYFIFNVAMSSAWGATPPNYVVGPCRGNATIPAPGSSDYNITNNICDSFPMSMEIDYIRVWQNSTMSYGCDPASHPTKEFIKGHILNYTDSLNPDISVSGKAMCSTNDDCTVSTSFTGSCVNRRCVCEDAWTGPRCTRYESANGTYGPSTAIAGSIVAFAFVGSAVAIVVRKRHQWPITSVREKKCNGQSIIKMYTSRRESDQRRVQQAGLSLLGLAFDGVGSACSSPRYVSPRAASPVGFEGAFVEGVDPQLFLEGVKEHAKYLGIDPDYDAEYLWIAKESLVAPMPTGWHQVVTKDGAPYYYNDHTGESRWEHPSDRDYMALFQEIKRRETSGERVDAHALRHQWFDRGYEESWGAYEESVASPSNSYIGDRTMEFSESEQDDEPPFQYEVKTKKKSSTSAPSAEEHKKLIETLYADINHQKQQIAELQQALLDAHNKQLDDTRINSAELEATITELKDSLKQSQQQVIVASAEAELVKSKAAQENLDLKEQVTTLQSRVKELEQSDKIKRKGERERLEKQVVALQKSCEELKRQVDDKNKIISDAQTEIESLKHDQEVQLESKAKEDHANAVEDAINTLKKQHIAEIDRLVQEHALAMEKANAEVQAHKLDIEKLLGVLESEKKDHLHKLEAIEAKAADAAKEHQLLQTQITKYKSKCKKLENGIAEKEATFATMAAELEASRSSINEQLSTAKEEGRNEANKEAESRVAAALAEKDQLAALYHQEMKARRQLHNKLMEMAGNIRVFCRVRPIQPVELKSEGSSEAVHFRPNDTQMLDLTVAEGQKHSFEFDYVFQPHSSQNDVFEQTKALVVSAMDGFNVCIFAYGQTGSGKTHTMEGSSSDRGVNFRAMEELFRVRDERLLSGNIEYDMKLSILEVYNETIVDLLDGTQTAGERKALEVRMGKQGAFVENLMEVEVNTTSDVEDLMKLGQSHRSVGGHDFNEHSSRSHLVLSLTITAIQKSDGKKAMSKLHLIDLAGSERISKTAASGQRLKEAQHINRSLSALGDVIASLGGNSKHVPYRNSKLTFLLQESLSGNSKVLMFVNVSPVAWNAWESLCSLNFALRCRSVALGQAKATTIAPASSPPSNGTQKKVLKAPEKSLRNSIQQNLEKLASSTEQKKSRGY